MKKMKKLLLMMMGAVILLASCDDNTPDVPETYNIQIALSYPDGYATDEEVTITLTNSANSTVMEANTDDSGTATFTVTAGVYNAAASLRLSGDGVAFILSGINSNITVNQSWDESVTVQLPLTASKLSQVIIKELFYGGTPKDDGSGSFNYDKYVVLYNNSAYPASLDNICLAITLPYNPHATNNDYIGGSLFYEQEGWVPAGQAFWHFTHSVTLDPGKEVVIALANAVDNTQTYSQSINFANEEYYATYDIEVFNHALTYPTPSAVIPTSHYLDVVAYGTGTAWTVSAFGPAFFLFAPQEQTIAQFAADETNINLYNGSSSLKRKKVPVEWVVDGVEVFYQPSDDNKKRLSASIDAGAVSATNKMGYSVYRNVDKEATEAIDANEGKLVYNYLLGTNDLEGGSTDPSGIDAEASKKNGARIVYKDSNNSTFDFHQRRQASLRQ